MPDSKRKKEDTFKENLDQPETLPDDQHPDYLAGTVGHEASEDEAEEGFTPIPGGPLPPPRPPFPGPLPGPGLPIPGRIPGPAIPLPTPRICGAVSGRYSYRPPFVIQPQPLPVRPGPFPARPIIPPRIPGPIVPINSLRITVRVDVDRFFPQNRISIEVTRTFPRSTAHAIAEVTSDSCHGFFRRTIRANITYRDGDASLIPGTELVFRARPGTGFGYRSYSIELTGGGISPRTYALSFRSRYFDPVEFEVDRVSNAGTVHATYDTGSHPNRPGDLASESLGLETVYQRAGFDASLSPNTSTIPTSGAGANGTWSDSEMHNAMVSYWSRFANNPQWAMWVLYAARHDNGYGLGGVMFDDIGANHRQGTAIFTDSFIQDVPTGDANPASWRARMQFWTAIHEMGHAFNLAHSWQKALGVPVAPGDPWIPLANEPEARSFMNYPFRVSGGESSFFSDFRFRFSDNELIFMRHAPRRFVQMGNSNWFVNHGFEAPDELMHTGAWALHIRPNRSLNTYRFLEPVTVELKLTNTSQEATSLDAHLLEDGRHITLFVQREGGQTRQWRPMVSHCHSSESRKLDPGESLYGAHLASASSQGWIIDEPGFYKLQAAIDLGEEIVVSNVLRLYVSPPATEEEANVAPDYFTEDVGRVLRFHGAPHLAGAEDVLKTVVDACAGNPAVSHAEVALSSPSLRAYKVLDTSGDRADMKVRAQKANVAAAAKVQTETLLKEPDKAADTLGHIPYFAQLRELAECLEAAGDDKAALKVMNDSVKVMKDRDILDSVITNTEARIKRRT